MADAYWAALPDSGEVVREFNERRRQYRDAKQRTGATGRATRALRCYYGWGASGSGDTSQLGVSGERGEYTEMAVNEFGGLVEQAYAQLVATKPAFQAVAKSGDYAAMSQAKFADQLLESVDRDLGVEEREDEATKLGLLVGEAWLVTSWDKLRGEEQGLDGQLTVRAGDVRADVCLPGDVVLDPRLRHKQDAQWLAFARPLNRWDLVALQQPREGDAPEVAERKRQLADALRDVDCQDDVRWAGQRDWLQGTSTTTDAADLLTVWELRHLPTPALPSGRLVQFVDDLTVLYDSAAEGVGYPYEGLCAQPFEPSKVVGTAHGNSLAWDLLSLQEAVDTVATAMATASGASAISNLWCPPGSNLTVAVMGKGLRIVESTVQPQPIHAVQVDPQAVAFLEACRSWMQRRMGLNDVALGDATKGMPAQLAALLDAKVVQFWNQAVKSLSVMRARVRSDILSLYKRFASAPRTAALAGKNNAWALEEWTKDKLSMVARVTVEPVSAVSKTLAGKMATADLLLERGLVNTPDEYLQIKSTGRLEKLTEFKDRNLLRLQQEKELLQQGIGLPPVDVYATDMARLVDPEAEPVFVDDGQPHIRPTVVDTPWLDIAEYAAVLASPDSRNNPAVVQACTDAIMAKVQSWRTMPPEVIAALGGMPPPPPGGLMPMPGEGGPDLPQPEGQMQPIKPPKPPPNPITGEQAPAPSDVSQPVPA